MALKDLFHRKKKNAEAESRKTKAKVGGEDAEEVIEMPTFIAKNISDKKFAKVVKKLEDIAKKNEGRERFVFDAPPIKNWVAIFLLGLALTVVFIYLLIIALGTMLYSGTYRMLGIYGIAIAAAMIFVNLLMMRKSVSEIRFFRRYDHYINVLRYRNLVIVDDLVNMIEVNRSVVEKDLSKAIKNKLIPQGHFGRENVIFIVSDKTYNTYSKRKAVFDRYFKKVIEERNRMKARTPEVEDLLEQGKVYIGKIRDCNDIIKDKEITDKLDVMERLVSTIFHEVDINPARANNLNVFIEYYLPTTEKLLDAYLDLDEKQIRSAGTEQTKQEISEAFDTINNAYKGLIERFYQEQERDIVSDIFAMETIMKQEGLTNGAAE